jgi:oligoribonuclease NrnB/cAMP/cGMP phosphodiesterase (DHH superfamily)
MKKVKLFTHTDIDGIGCAIVGICAYSKENIDIEYCEVSEINDKVLNFLRSPECSYYDTIYITDISVNTSVAEIINTYYYYKVILLDHHVTAEWLNMYSWATVKNEAVIYVNDNSTYLTSGTYLFYKNLNKILSTNCANINRLWYIVDMIRQYDTWEWQTIFHDDHPKKWNDLMSILGRDRFIDRVLYHIENSESNCNILFDETEKLLLELEEEKTTKYIKEKSKELIVTNLLNYKVGVIFGERYQSLVGHQLSTDHPELDFIVIINVAKAISYRTCKTNINLGTDVAKIFGGGGHEQSAGSPITEAMQQQILKIIFNK